MSVENSMKLCDDGNETLWNGPRHSHAKWQKCNLNHERTGFEIFYYTDI